VIVAAKELSTIAMVNGNESKYKIVIDNGVLKEWVGFGWIILHGGVTPEDSKKYPTVERGEISD
jgi:hypothetical protein